MVVFTFCAIYILYIKGKAGIYASLRGYYRLPTNLPSYLPACLSARLPACPPARLPARLPAYLPTHLPAYLPTYPPACLSAYLPVSVSDSIRGRGRPNGRL